MRRARVDPEVALVHWANILERARIAPRAYNLQTEDGR
jgi:hypothetical protein